jgi:hypothetical protein
VYFKERSDPRLYKETTPGTSTFCYNFVATTFVVKKDKNSYSKSTLDSFSHEIIDENITAFLDGMP